MAVSIKDIARIAGVSHSTVSRALRGSPLIPRDTAERIKKIAEEAGYAPSAVARSLATRQTHAIGVVVTSIADPFNGEVVAGLEEIANQEGYTVILATSQADRDREIAVVQEFRSRRVDGIVVASSRVGALHAELLARLSIPFVLLNNQHPSGVARSVSFDDFEGARAAALHLLSLGHTQVAYLGDELGLESNTLRMNGVAGTLRQAGIDIPRSLISCGNGKAEGVPSAFQRLLEAEVQPTAIVCYNDMTALGVLSECRQRGITVPDQLSVVGFDDIFFASYLQPSLTTVRQPKRLLGQRAMQMMLEELRGQALLQNELVKGELIVRGSTAPPHL